MKHISLSLILPMYNEKEYLPEAISIAKTVFNEITSDYEIIIVDDASTDGSAQIADDIAKVDNTIKVIHNPKNRKLGGTLRTGFFHASKALVVYTDMDLPFDLHILKEIIPLSVKFDILTGYRIGRRESLLRTLYTKGYNFLINFIFDLKLKDVNSALKIFKKEILDHLKLKSEGSFINAEFLIKAKKLAYLIKEVEVDYRPRRYGKSHLASPGVIFKILFELVKLYPEIRFSEFISMGR